MRTGKLIDLLSSVRPEEMRWLAKFVRSPYYNANVLVTGLFDYLRSYHPDFDSPKLEKQAVFKHLLPDQPYDDRRLRLIMFRLSEVVEEFLVAQRLKSDRLRRDELLVDELGERNQYELFEKRHRTLIEEWKKAPYRDESYYLNLWRLQHRYFYHPQTARFDISAEDLAGIMENLDAFYLLSKMRYGAELRNRENILSERHQIWLLPECRDLAARHPVFGGDKVFQVSRDVLSLMEQPQEEAIYRRLEDNVIANHNLFRPEDQSALLRYLINATIQLYNTGRPAFLRNQFRLYCLGLEKELFLREGELSDITFLNIIVTATVLKEIDWVEGFIQKYGASVPAEAREDAVLLGQAYWHFVAGRFDESNALLRRIENIELQYLLRIKSLTLRNHFEIFLSDETYYDLWIHESRAYEKFLRRDKRLAGARVQAYLNLIYFLRKLAKWRMNRRFSEKKLAKLEQELAGTPSVVARQWLEEKLAGATMWG